MLPLQILLCLGQRKQTKRAIKTTHIVYFSFMLSTPTELNLLKSLVAFPSVTSNSAANRKLLNFIESYLRERGMHTVMERCGEYSALIATTRFTNRPTIMLTGHCDVVPAKDSLFTLREKEGKLYGRGVWDMKSAIAGYMTVVDRLKDNLQAYDFGVMIVSDEEVNDKSTGELLDRGYVPRVAILPDGAADWRVESRAKGAWNIHITVSGISAHGSRPWEGDSASLKLLDLLTEIRQLFGGNDKDACSLNISVLTCGEAHNQIPDRAKAVLDVRAPDFDEHGRINSAMRTICERYGAKMTVQHFFPPIEHDFQNQYFTEFIQSIEKVTGKQHEGIMSYGASSAVHFVGRNIPCILTQPTGGDRHGPHEWVDKASFLHMVPILQDFIERTARTDMPVHRAGKRPAKLVA